MRCIYIMAVFTLALTMVFAGITAAQQDLQSKDKQEQPRADFRGDDGPNAQQIEQLWQQIAQLHKQIVTLEVNQSASTRTPGATRFDREKREQDGAEPTGSEAGQDDERSAFELSPWLLDM